MGDDDTGIAEPRLGSELSGDGAPGRGAAVLGEPATVVLETIDTSDAELDRFAAMVCRLVHVPVAFVALARADSGRQSLPGAAGLPEPLASTRRAPLSSSVCERVVASGRPFVVADTRVRDGLPGDRAMADLQALAFAAIPLSDPDGRVVGSLCAVAREARVFTPGDLATLNDLAAVCSSSLGRRAAERRARDAERAANRATRQARLLLRFSEAMVQTGTQDEVLTAVQGLASSTLGATHAELVVGDRRSAHHVGTGLRSAGDRSAGDRSAGDPFAGVRWAGDRRRSPDVDPGADLPGTRVLRTGRALMYADEAALLADFPGLRPDQALPRGGARAFLPLSAGGRPLGWLGLAWPAPREMDGDLRELLGSLARTTSQAMQRADLLEQRREVALTLQDALLSTLPTVPGLELAARYNPAGAAEKVGGDWYDALAFPRSTTLVIGDVTGHDVSAAAEMGHLRSILRGFAVDRADSPAELLGRLDRANLALGSGTVATALVAHLEAAGPRSEGAARLTWSSAGHYAPVLVHADGRAAQLVGRSDLLLGVDGGTPRTDWVDRVPTGSTLLLFTDGLVELRGRRVRDRLDELEREVALVAREPLGVLLDAVLAAMAHEHDQDDVAVLAARPVG